MVCGLKLFKINPNNSEFMSNYLEECLLIPVEKITQVVDNWLLLHFGHITHHAAMDAKVDLHKRIQELNITDKTSSDELIKTQSPPETTPVSETPAQS